MYAKTANIKALISSEEFPLICFVERYNLPLKKLQHDTNFIDTCKIKNTKNKGQTNDIASDSTGLE